MGVHGLEPDASLHQWRQPRRVGKADHAATAENHDFGVELREQISHLKLNSFTKDFRLAVEGNGGLPLGNKLLGGRLCCLRA